MECKKCGNEIFEGEKFCGKCGTKVELDGENVNAKRSIQIKLIYLMIIFLIIMVVAFGVIAKNNNGNFELENLNIFKKHMSNEELIEILKNSDNGIYLQKDTVDFGTSSDLDYKNYNKLISYSCKYVNGAVTLNSGGLLILNDKQDKFKLVKLRVDYNSIIYYLNTENEKDKLGKITSLMSEYISSYGIDNFVISENNVEKYMTLGKKIGEVVGVDLCRDIIREATIKATQYTEAASLVQSSKFFYKRNEISPRYIGCYTTEQVYNWSIPETAARFLYSSDRKSYNNMVAVYGQPYKYVKKFVVYDFIKEGTPKVGNYENENAVENKLGVEQ